MKKKFLYIFFASILLIGGIVTVCLNGGDDDYDDYDFLYYLPPQTENIVEEQDYSWLYEGKWEINDQGDRYVVSFNPNGHYISYFQSAMWGRSSYQFGRYTIEKGRIWLYEAGDEEHPGYIDIEGKRLTSDGLYYRHID